MRTDGRALLGFVALLALSTSATVELVLISTLRRLPTPPARMAWWGLQTISFLPRPSRATRVHFVR